MKLKEIEIDLPYQKNYEYIYSTMERESITYEEAVRKDYEINWKDKRRDFQLMTRCMTSMIERIMQPIVTKDCRKIIVECINNQTDQKCINWLGVYSVPVQVDLSIFYISSDYKKKEIAIDIVLKGIRELSQYVSFELNNIIDACQEIRKKSYKNEWVWKRVKLEEKYVEVKIQHEVMELNIWIMTLDKEERSLTGEMVIKTAPDERVYGQYLGKLLKISGNMVVLIDGSGNEIKKIVV